MSGPKHTPGPWKACKDGECRCGMVFGGGGNILVATATWPDDESGHGPKAQEEQRANAKLIAAAPRLADALKRCTDALDSFVCDPPGFPAVEWTEEDAEAVREAFAALREAGVS